MEEITTERLTIRDFKASDWKEMFDYLSDPEVVRFEPYEPYGEEQAKKEAARRAGDANFRAVCLPDGKLIGNLYLAPGDFNCWELGYVFNRHYWGKGYATEAAGAAVKYIFKNMDANRVIAMCNPENERSWKLMERLGMRREGVLKKNIWFKKDGEGNPIWQDTYEYGLLEDER